MTLIISRKAMSPLMATLILIGFSIALGAVVTSMGESFIESRAEFVQGNADVSSSCSTINVNLLAINNQPKVCASNNQVSAYVESTGTDIENIDATIVGTNLVTINENILSTPLHQGETRKIVFTHNSVGDYLQIKFTPKAATGKELATCYSKTVVLENIPSC